MNSSCVLSWFSFAAPTTVAPSFLTGRKPWRPRQTPRSEPTRSSPSPAACRLSSGRIIGGRRARGVHAVRDDQHVLAGQGRTQARRAGELKALPSGVLPLGLAKLPRKLLQRRGIKGPELDRLPRAVPAEHEQAGLDFPGRAGRSAGGKGLNLLGDRHQGAVGDDIFGRRPARAVADSIAACCRTCHRQWPAPRRPLRQRTSRALLQRNQSSHNSER